MPADDANIYGEDKLNDSAQAEAQRVLTVPKPTEDVWGESDPRAVTQGNHGRQS